jgi:acetyl esterase/lipase
MSRSDIQAHADWSGLPANARSTGWRLRRAGWIALLLSMATLATSCALAPIPGEGTLRYRDALFSGATKTADIVYGSAPGQDGNPVVLKLDLYRPTGDTVARRPLIVWVHGGAFRTGSKTSAEIVDQATVFSRKGYVNASISYRLGLQGCVPAAHDCFQSILNAADDARTAIRFLRSHAADYGIDPTRIAIGGTSAGAITALRVAYGADGTPEGLHDPASAVRGAVSLSGAALGGDAIDPIRCAHAAVPRHG